MELVDRIKTIMKVNQLSASQLADEIGVQRSNVSHVLSERNKPSFEFIHKLLVRFPKVNAHWLITGTSQEAEQASPPSESKSEQTTLLVTESPPKSGDKKDSSEVERIVVFYTDQTFRIYGPKSELLGG